MKPHPKDDPIAFVLESLLQDATSIEQPVAQMLAYVAEKDYANAMVLAIAIEVSRAKHEEQSRYWTEHAIPDGVDKSMVLDEVGRRTLFWYLLTHRNDHRTMKIEENVCPPIKPLRPNSSMLDLALKDAAEGSTASPPSRSEP